MSGHRNENLPHYHLYIKFPSGTTKEMPAVFQRSAVGIDGSEKSATVQDIYNFVKDQYINEPFTLYWKGKKLDNPNIKLRQIVVDSHKLVLYKPINDPIVVIFNKELEPLYVESHDLDLVDFTYPQTPR